MKRLLSSDLGVYLLSGAFSFVVFVVGLIVLDATLPDGLDRGRLVGIVTGYLLFLAVYVVAIWIYRGIEAREGNVREKGNQ
ncbi:hypothetical protein GCM10027435_14630 [Haloparvum alkalitolerans]|uniref:hypothetical protein n=1 Tax=Haloparvum alkalitolerans TaxID=1042953 RepID=UPI003CE94FAC